MQKFLKNKKEYCILFFIIACGALLRLYNLNWDEGHFLHPDERLYVNASSISFPNSFEEVFSPTSPLNPNMFYYGSFPLYLYKIIHAYIVPSTNFLLTSRFISALFSIATIPIIFLLGKSLFSSRVGLLASILFAFGPGSIQHAHFNTTESILVFFLSLTTFVSIFAVRVYTYSVFIFLGILVGISYATKIVGATFSFLPLLTLVILYIKHKRWENILSRGIIFFLIALLTGSIFAPYQIIDFPQFLQEQEYMQGVTYGKYKPPFIIIYENTFPYLYPILQIFPFTLGFITFPLSLIGFLLLIKSSLRNKKNYLLAFIILYPFFYFLWAGMWYAKFSRYYMLLFPFQVLFAAYFLNKLHKVIIIFITLCIAINGLLFLRIYTQQHTRISASQWIYQDIPQGSTIATEHWDDGLPLPISGKTSTVFILNELRVYEPDTPEKIMLLSETVSNSDYIVFSSRRVSYSIMRNSTIYPTTSTFYDKLFAGNLGYILEKKFTNYPYYISDDFADESFQSYDHPPVYIFRNNKKFSSLEIKNRISNAN